MNYEVEIQKLNERIQKLEEVEAKRVLRRKIEIGIRVSALLIIVILLIVGYIYVNNKYIKPYKEKLDYVNEKVESVEGFVDDKWEALKKFDIFN